MEYTPNANLKKPGYSDTVDIKDINDNFDAVDEHIGADISDTTGAHGMRYNETDSVFEVLDAETNQWTAIKCGKSPYEYAVAGGYTGTEAEFKAILASGPWLPTDGGVVTGDVKISGDNSGVVFDGASVKLGLSANNLAVVTEDSTRGNPIYQPLQVASPIGNNDAATKKYVDDAVESAGGSNCVTYGTCSSASSTSAKVVSATGFTLKTGAEIWVRFTSSNTAESPTLNVNSTGAKYIKKYGTTSPSSYMWAPGAVVGFVYDGTYWIMVNGTTATTSYYGITRLNNTTTSTSTTEAATAGAVKAAYDHADSALPRSGGDITGNIDMQNNVITGLPSPVAPSDAVNYHSLVAMFLNTEIVAQVSVSISGGAGDITGYVSMRKVAFYGTDVVFEVSGSVPIQTGSGVIGNITVTFPEVFKRGYDWSDLGGYGGLIATYDGNSYSMGPTGWSNLEYSTGTIGKQQKNGVVEISGYIRVGVNA